MPAAPLLTTKHPTKSITSGLCQSLLLWLNLSLVSFWQENNPKGWRIFGVGLGLSPFDVVFFLLFGGTGVI